MAKAKINLKNIKRFLQGWYRYILYKLQKHEDPESLNLLPLHKQEQFRYRLQIMDKQCLADGKCKICGCETPQLQMIDDACEGKCYPNMMSKEEWDEFKRRNYN